MSLQVWLPLNGNLENQGLSGVKPTISSPVYSNGKIGQCLLLDRQIDTTLPFANWDYITNSCSFGCWVKVSLADLQIIANGETFNSPYRTMGGTLLGKDSYGGVALRWQTNDLSSSKTITRVELYGHIRNTNSNAQYTTSYILPFDTWTHVVLVINRITQTMGIYINGKLFNEKGIEGVTGSFSTGNFLICQSSWDGGNGISSPGKFSLNDVRVYDHALSAKEVKELAKGLVLHYRLAGPGQENLITTMAAGGRTTLVDKYTLNADFGQNIDTYGWISVKPALELDKIYTLSFDVLNMPVGSRWGFQLWNNNNYHFWIEGNGHYSYTFCPSTSKLPSGYSLNRFLFDDSSKTNPAGIVTFTNFKIEEGSIATPWCPHKDDPLYSAMGYNNNIEYDCSGYRRNGTKSGNITWDIDSPRYTTSYSTKGGTAYLTSSNVFTFSIHNFTLSILGKTSNQGGRMIFSSGPATSNPALYHSGRLAWCVGDGDNNYFENNGVAIQAADYKDGKWHHYVVTGDGIENKLYIDGQYAGKSHIYHPLGYTYTLGKWIGDTSHNWDGLMSDFRIYVTTLSAEDIAELYHSAVIVDNTGKSYAYEYFEAQ